MEPRGRLRSHGQGSIRSPTDHYQRNLSAAESSDEDDDDIPANKPPSVSPSKRLSLSATRLSVQRAKRSLSDTVRGGIVLYPGSKRPRNGYNMAPISRESLPRSTPDALRARSPTHFCTDSLSSEDDVREGLVRSVNDALRHLQARQTQDDTEQQLELGGAPNLHVLHKAESEEWGDAGNCVDIHHLVPGTLPLHPDVLNGVGEEIKQILPASEGHSATVPVGATPNREKQAQTEVQTRMYTVLPSLHDKWEVPNLPGQPIAVEEHTEAPLCRSQTLQPTKKRGRPPKFSAKTSPNEAPDTGKKKLGRPRKHCPPLRDETDKDHNARIGRLQMGIIPSFLGPDTQVLRQSSLILNDTTPQTAPGLDLEPKAEPGEDAGWSLNHAELSVRDINVDNQSTDFGRDDKLTQCGPIEYNDGGHPDSDANKTDGTLSEFIDGFDSDSGSRSDVDRSFKDSFECDVDAFNARQFSHLEEDDVFESPLDDDVLAIHLDHQSLKQLCKLLGDNSWAGVKDGWQWQYFHYEDAKTKPARALLSLLTKLERLYQAAPKAPNLKEQNRFLREHADMLRYYFYQIKIVVEHIRTKRLEIPERNETTQNTDPRKRKMMMRDLVLFVIPMLAHVLASVWGLGGKTWTKISPGKTSFTSATVELFKRVLGWTMTLHYRLLSELERCPLEERPEGQGEQQAWLRRNGRREEIGPLIDNLCQVILDAPDQLAETKARAEEELKRHQRQLRREKQLQIEQKAAEEARQALVAERKKKSLLSTHAIHHRLGSPAVSSQPSSSLTLRSTEWSIEEQRLLFLRIQASFPVCPDLDDLRWELNKTVAQTVAMTEQILEKMLARVLIGYSAEERAAELRQIMHNSGMVGL